MKQLKRIKFTPEGYRKLLDEQTTLKTERKDALESLKRARELGDLSENGLYKGARMRLSGIDHRLRRIELELKLAEVIEYIPSHEVKIGSKVIVTDGENEITYEIVGDLEANPKEQKISLNSPLGRALENKKQGDKVNIQTPTKTRNLSIVSVK